MQYRTLGRTGLKVSAIAMGTFTFGGRDAFARQGIKASRRPGESLTSALIVA